MNEKNYYPAELVEKARSDTARQADFWARIEASLKELDEQARRLGISPKEVLESSTR